MAVEFRLANHSIKAGVKIVEIILDGSVVCDIYPEERGVKIVSAHFSKVSQDDGSRIFPPIPSVDISFKPRRYIFRGNKIEYLE